MTNEEAINLIMIEQSNIMPIGNGREVVQAFDMAIEALKNQNKNRMDSEYSQNEKTVKHYCRKCHRELFKFDYVTGFCGICNEPIPPKDNPYDKYYEGE